MQPPYVNINFKNRCYVYDTSKPVIPLILSGTRYDETRLPMADLVVNGPTYFELLQQMQFINQPKAESSSFNVAESDLPSSGTNIGNSKLAECKSQGCNNEIVKTTQNNNELAKLCQELNISEEDFVKGSAPPVRRAAISLLTARERLHNRSCHIGFHRLELALRHSTCIGLDTSLSEFLAVPQMLCEICEIAKFKRFPLTTSLKLNADQMQYAITIDYKQFNTRSLRGYKYFTLVLHHSTTYLIAILAKSKSEMAEQVMKIRENHLTKNGIELHRIHSDSDAIYQSGIVPGFAASNNIELTFTAPYRHEGSIERYMQSVLDTLRATMIDGNISTLYWDYILVNAVIPTINAFPNAKFPKSSPYEQLFGKLMLASFVQLVIPL